MFTKDNPHYKAALYIRVSTEEQARHGYSVDEQKHDLAEYAKAKGYDIFGIYADEGLSARKAISRRKALQQLLNDVRAGLIDVIVIKCLDRWFRSVRDFYRVQDLLDKHNVTWECTQEQYNTATTTGRLMLNLKLTIAQNESDQTSDRVKYINEGKRRRREVIAARIPLGYRVENKHLVHDDATAAIVVDVFEYFVNHPSLYAVMHYLADQHKIIRAYSSVRKLLANKVYIGEQYGDPEYNDAIVPRELFDTVQNLLQRHERRKRTSRIYLFSGLLRCPSCGCFLGVQCHSCKQNTIHYIYYRCNLSFRHTICQNRFYVAEAALEQKLLSIFNQELSAFIAEHKAGQAEIISINRTKFIREKMRKLKNLYLDELIERSEYERDYRALSRQLDNAETSTATLHRPIRSALLTLSTQNVPALYKNLSRSERKNFWRNYVDRIEFDKNGKPHIFFR